MLFECAKFGDVIVMKKVSFNEYVCNIKKKFEFKIERESEYPLFVYGWLDGYRSTHSPQSPSLR